MGETLQFFLVTSHFKSYSRNPPDEPGALEGEGEPGAPAVQQRLPLPQPHRVKAQEPLANYSTTLF